MPVTIRLQICKRILHLLHAALVSSIYYGYYVCNQSAGGSMCSITVHYSGTSLLQTSWDPEFLATFYCNIEVFLFQR